MPELFANVKMQNVNRVMKKGLLSMKSLKFCDWDSLIY